MKDKGFIHWLRSEKDFWNTQTRDIANDVIWDWKDGWRGSTFDDLIKRMDKLNGSDLAMEGAWIAFKEYMVREYA